MKNTGDDSGPRAERGRRRRPRGRGSPAGRGPRALEEPGRLTVEVSNRQRKVPVDGRQVGRLTRLLLGELLGMSRAQLSICLLDDAGMARLNETYLHHAGPTDVITFDYHEAGGAGDCDELYGEICLGVEEAQRQARRYGTSWPEELTRYLVHGVLHLLGYDDQQPAVRRRMKQQEDRLLRALRRRFPARTLCRCRHPCHCSVA